MTEINIEGVIFQIKQLFGMYCVFDSADKMVGRADNLPDAVAICEQIAWRRKVDGKVDDSVDEKLTKDAVGDEIACSDCIHEKIVHRYNKDIECTVLCKECQLGLKCHLDPEPCAFAKRRT